MRAQTGFVRYTSSRRDRDFNTDARSEIIFTTSECNESQILADYLNSPNRQKMLYLLNPAYNFDVFKYIPRLFSIVTTNGTYKFNINFLQNSSSIINKYIENNPNSLEYHLNTADYEDIMKKIEQLYMGQKIEISEKEAYLFKLVTIELDIFNNIRRGTSYNDRVHINNKYQMILSNFYSFLKNSMPKTFKISTKNKEYECNMIGIHSSTIIHELLSKNPNLDHFEYDFDDEFGEYQQICNFFNLNFVKITTDNMYSIKMIAEDLQINYILDEINKFIDDYEKRIQTIDDQQSLIDSIDELFDTLYKIKEITVKSVKDKIIESSWSKTDEKVQELAAFILQVVQTDSFLHPYMIDLIEILNKEANETNGLGILVPFIVKKLIFNFRKNKQICLFIYMMHKRGFISKEDINEQLKKISNGSDKISSLIVFIPELYEIFKFNINKLVDYFNSVYTKFIRFYIPDNIEKFKKMRDSGEPDDQITLALRNDDVDTLQKIISNGQFDLSEAYVPYNIYDISEPSNLPSYINYACYCGSLKCFKYLILNHASIDNNSFSSAVFGGNIEIVKILDQQITEILKKKKDVKTNKTSHQIRNEPRQIGYNLENIIPSIKKHQNDLFDWLFEQKFIKTIQDKELTQRLLLTSSENGNPHSIATIIDRGFDFLSLDRDFYRRIIQITSKNGFYKLLQFLSIILNKNFERDNQIGIFDYDSSVFFGNLSIFKFYLQRSTSNINNALSAAVEKECVNIVKYIFETDSVRERVDFNTNLMNVLLSYSIKIKPSYIFKYLLEQFDKYQKNLFVKFFNKYDLLSQACFLNRIEIAKEITNIMVECQNENEKINFSLPFYNAVIAGSIELCQFFIDKKVYIDFKLITLQYQKLILIKDEILDIIIENMTVDARIIFLNAYLKEAISNKNKKLIEHLLKEKATCDDLIVAVRTGDLEIVDMILKYRSDPLFINHISEKGTALNVAVTLNFLLIVKRLLSLPGIDPSLYTKNNTTPLISAIIGLKIETINEILNFYGSDLKSQTWQLNEAVERFLNKLSTLKDHKNNANYLVVLNRLLEIEYIDLNLHADKYTLFGYACEANEIDIAKMLMKLDKVNINSYAPTNGNSPLMIAIENNNIEIVKILIECERTNINQRNYDDDTALIISVKRKRPEIIDLIINDKRFDPVESRLNYAFYMANEEMAEKLITAKDLDVNYKRMLSPDSDNRRINSVVNFNITNTLNLFSTPLTSAVKNSKKKLVDLIINHSSFDPKQSFVVESLFVICRNQTIDPEIFTSLIKFVNNDVNLKDYLNHSLFETAVRNNNKNIIDIILKSEFFDSKRSNLINSFIISYSREEPFMDIMYEIYEFDKNHEKLIDFSNLLPSGDSFFTSIVVDKSNRSLTELVEFFLEKGVDPNKPSSSNVYPLEYAIRMGNFDFVSALINSGKIDFNIKLKPKKSLKGFQMINNDEGYLHIAVRSDEPNILSILLRTKKFDINAEDSNGETPLMKACRYRSLANLVTLFKEDNLDYLKCNKNGDDSMKIAIKNSRNKDLKLKPVESKEHYRMLLSSILSNSPIPYKLAFYKESENNTNETKVTQNQQKENQNDNKNTENLQKNNEIKVNKNDENDRKETDVKQNEIKDNKNTENERKEADVKDNEIKENKNVVDGESKVAETKESESKEVTEQSKTDNKLSVNTDNSKDKEKVAPAKKFSFNISKPVQAAEKKSTFSASAKQDQKIDKNTKFAVHKPDQTDQKSDTNSKLATHKFTPKTDLKFSFKSAMKSDKKAALPNNNNNDDDNVERLDIQNEVMEAINKSLVSATPEQVQEISKNLSAILERKIKQNTQNSDPKNQQNESK